MLASILTILVFGTPIVATFLHVWANGDDDFYSEESYPFWGVEVDVDEENDYIGKSTKNNNIKLMPQNTANRESLYAIEDNKKSSNNLLDITVKKYKKHDYTNISSTNNNSSFTPKFDNVISTETVLKRKAYKKQQYNQGYIKNAPYQPDFDDGYGDIPYFNKKYRDSSNELYYEDNGNQFYYKEKNSV